MSDNITNNTVHHINGYELEDSQARQNISEIQETLNELNNDNTGSNIEITQELGDSETLVMSQKAVTDELNNTNEKIENIVNYIPAEEPPIINIKDLEFGTLSEHDDYITDNMLWLYTNGTRIPSTNKNFIYLSTKNLIPVEENKQYTLVYTLSGFHPHGTVVFIVGPNTPAISNNDELYQLSVPYNQPQITFTVPAGCHYIGINIQIEANVNDYIANPETSKNLGWDKPLTLTKLITGDDLLIPVLNENVIVKQSKLLDGKKIAIFGHSIIANNSDGKYKYNTTTEKLEVTDFDYINPYSVTGQLSKITGATVYNCAFGGTRMSIDQPTQYNVGYATYYNPFCLVNLIDAIESKDWSTQDAVIDNHETAHFKVHLANLKMIDFTQIDYVIINHLANDFSGGDANVPDNKDNIKDTYTVCGALRYCVEKLYSINPKLKIFIAISTYSLSTTQSNDNIYERLCGNEYLSLTFQDYVDAMRTTASEYNLPFIDGARRMGINKFNVAQYTVSDHVHLNNAENEAENQDTGCRLYAEFLAGQLLSFGDTDYTVNHNIITSPNGKKWKLNVSNEGELSVTELTNT